MAILTLSRKPDVTKVDKQHIPYVEVLWNALVETRDSLAAKREYLQTARAVGVKVASLDNIGDLTDQEDTSLRKSLAALERIKKVLALGGDPTTPPSAWYCGHLNTPESRTRFFQDKIITKEYPNETWPSYGVHRRAKVFTGPMPIEALRAVASMGELVDGMRVYSPEERHFAQLPEPIVKHIDPVLVGSIFFLGTNQYFTLARWDIASDLAKIFGKPSHQKNALEFKEPKRLTGGRVLDAYEEVDAAFRLTDR